MSVLKRNHMMLPNLMNEMFAPDWFGGKLNTSNLPPVNIVENEKDYLLELSVPGQQKEDFNISVDESVLTIATESKAETSENTPNYTRREFFHSSFKRVFTLPDTVDEEGIGANYENGILRLVLPKKEEALPKPKRLISLS